ncbi:ATP/GTP-binding protein [Nocardiopsis sp. NPDC006938]|uniref:AAA family ATPase n=1 Tax=Nocardiopsis sp. NPDC006938 TaxID=3364337 RepID=UPI0036BE0028
MLLSFRVENHKSIREEQQLLLTPVYDDARPESADWEAVTVAGIFGANASGKSNLLDALVFMRDTVRWSMNNAEPGGAIRRQPFALDTEAATDPSVFVVDLMISGVRHTYGFAVDDERVTEEWLYTYPKRRRRVLFERDGAEFTFGDSAPAKLRQVKDITGPNILFLTVAARASNEDVEPIYRWFSDDLTFASERSSRRPTWLTERQVTLEELARLGDLLRSADTGVHSVALRTWSENVGGLVHTAEGRVVASEERRESLREETGRVERGERGPSSELLFHHGDSSARPFTWDEESQGTRSLAALGYEVQGVLAGGGVLVVDELDASLHPHLSAQVISLFQDPVRNPHGAQLVFTSHDAALLGQIRGEHVLLRDHVWFVEKDACGRTTLHPLSDLRPRGEENRARRYLVGLYGGVPDLDESSLRDALVERDLEARGPDPEGAHR